MPQDLLRDLKAVKERGIKYDSLAFGSSNWVDGAAIYKSSARGKGMPVEKWVGVNPR